jgi:transposase-like protein
MRRTYTRAERDELIRAVTSGDRVPAAASRLGVGVATAYDWVRQAGARGTASARKSASKGGQRRPAFVRLVAASGREVSLVVRVGGAEIEVRPGFDSGLLQAVVAALGGGGT